MAYRNHRNAASRPSIYQTVTDRIIASLKAGVIPWEKPWKTPRYAGGPFPRNFYTGKPYRGINVLLLWSSEYNSPFWLTFKQAQALKGTVRKGEHGTQISFYKQLPEHAKKDEKGSGEDERVPFVLCHYTVFNVEQCDGLTLPEISQPAIAPEIDEDELCESIVTGWESRPALHLNSPTEYRAYYRPSTDSVHMPARSRFVDAPHYYSTLFHELVHNADVRIMPRLSQGSGVHNKLVRCRRGIKLAGFAKLKISRTIGYQEATTLNVKNRALRKFEQ